MKKTKIFISILLIVVIGISFLACGTKKQFIPTTSSELVAQSLQLMSELGNNYSINLQIDFDLKMDVSVEDAKIDVIAPLKLQTIVDVDGTTMYGNMKVTGSMNTLMEYNGSQQTQTEPIDDKSEFYVQQLSNETVMYSKNNNNADNDWIKNTYPNTKLAIYQLVLNQSLFDNAELQKNEDTYVISIQLIDLLQTQEFQSLLNSAMLANITNSEFNIDTLINSCGESTVTYTFDKDFHLTKIMTGKIPLNLLKTIDQSQLSDMGIENIDQNANSASITVNVDFDKFGLVSIPKDNIPIELEQNVVGEEVEDTPNQELTQNKTSIANDWTKMDIEIDGVLYKYPYDYELLKQNGWFIDSNSESSLTLESKEETYTTIDLFHDLFNNPSNYDGTMIYVSFINNTEQVLKIANCDIISIDINISYGTQLVAQYPKVVIAHGITWGSQEADVLKAFGEPDEIYESPNEEYMYKSLSWYNDDATKSMEITIDNKFGVTSITYTTYPAVTN